MLQKSIQYWIIQDTKKCTIGSIPIPHSSSLFTNEEEILGMTCKGKEIFWGIQQSYVTFIMAPTYGNSCVKNIIFKSASFVAFSKWYNLSIRYSTCPVFGAALSIPSRNVKRKTVHFWPTQRAWKYIVRDETRIIKMLLVDIIRW